MGFISNLLKNREIQNAKTPLQRLFAEAKWDAIEKDTNDLEIYGAVQEMMENATKEYGYTDEGRERCEMIIQVAASKFQDKRFVEFLKRAFNGEK